MTYLCGWQKLVLTRGPVEFAKQTEMSLLKQVASIYWDLVGLLETIEVKKKAVELSEKLLRDNQARLETGVLNSN